MCIGAGHRAADDRMELHSFAARAEHALMLRLARLGERIGSQTLIYNPLVMRYFHRTALEDAYPVMKVIASEYPEAHRMVDVGAGSGAYAAAAQRVGLGVIALERSRVGRRLATRQGLDARPFDLGAEPAADVDQQQDLAYCLEVAEHLEPPLGDRLVAFLAGLAPDVVFTAAPPGQDGFGHVNVQPKAYWIERFDRSGLRYQPERSRRLANGFRVERVGASWLISNVMAFSSTPEPG